MTRIIIRELVWDRFNKQHIGKHKVTIQEIERVSRTIIIHQKTRNERYLIIGRDESRILTVIVKRVKTGIYYPITARDAAKKERRKLYEKEKK